MIDSEILKKLVKAYHKTFLDSEYVPFDDEDKPEDYFDGIKSGILYDGTPYIFRLCTSEDRDEKPANSFWFEYDYINKKLSIDLLSPYPDEKIADALIKLLNDANFGISFYIRNDDLVASYVREDIGFDEFENALTEYKKIFIENAVYFDIMAMASKTCRRKVVCQLNAV